MQAILSKLSLKNKIIGSIVLLVSVLSIFVYFYFPSRQNTQAYQARYEEAERLATILSYGVVAGLEFDDQESVESSLVGAKTREDLVVIEVLDHNGNIFYRFDRDEDVGSKKQSSKDRLSTETAILSEGKEIGTLRLELSLYDLNARASANRSAILLVSALIIGIGILFGMYVAKIIIQPIVNINSIVQKLAEGDGDLSQRIEVQSDDEVGEFSAGFNNFLDKLADLIRKVKNATQHVMGSVSQISSVTVEMAAGAEQQAGQTSEVATSVQEMTAAIVENSSNATQTASIAEKANSKATEGTAAMQETRMGMDEIVSATSRTSEIVNSLSNRADQIGAIIQVIDEIADQTNLLALNAAIEAARAGEQGRGFAVVADEVRKLAERTTKATQEIAETIKAIQSDTTEASESMLEANNLVNQGKEAAAKTEQVLSEIVGAVTKVMDMIRQIAAASEEQSSGAEEISKNVESISAVTRETASGAEQLASAAEQLNLQTESLNSVVNLFKLSEDIGSDQNHQSDRIEHSSGVSKMAVSKNGVVV